MATIRRVNSPFAHFTIISNTLLRDRSLSLKARGLAGWLLSHQDGWETSVAAIVRDTGAGKDAVGGAVRELERAGYLRRQQTRDADFRLRHVVYEIQCTPFEDEKPSSIPLTGNPHTASGGAENPTKPKSVSAENPHTSVTPDAGFPLPGFPSTGNPHTKKTTPKKTILKNTSPPSAEVREDEATAEKPKPKRARNAYSAEFEAWWAVYPARNGTKAGKLAASREFAKARRTESVEFLTEAARLYTTTCNGYPKDAERWLKAQMWEDARDGLSPSGEIELTNEQVDQILGKSTWSAPPPPRMLTIGSPEYLSWYQHQLGQHREQRRQTAHGILAARRNRTES